jgi:hypothetical protein
MRLETVSLLLVYQLQEPPAWPLLDWSSSTRSLLRGELA